MLAYTLSRPVLHTYFVDFPGLKARILPGSFLMNGGYMSTLAVLGHK